MRKASAKQRKDVADLLDHVNKDVDRLSPHAMRSIAPALHEAQLELEKDLRRWLGSVEDGEERFTAFQFRRALYQVRGSLDAIQDVSPDIVKGLRGASVYAGALAQRHIAEELAIFSSRFSGSLNPIPLLEAAQISQKSLVERFKKSANRWGDRNVKVIRHQLALGMVRGETFDQMTKRLMGKLGPKAEHLADRADVIARRFGGTQRHEAERLVRTETMNAYNEVKASEIKSLAKDDAGIMMRWDSSRDGRTCADCRDRDGKLMKPGSLDGPPAHPFCRCVLLAFKEGWD